MGKGLMCIIMLAVATVSSQVAASECLPEKYVGPKPGDAYIWTLPDGRVHRMIGMGIESEGVYRVMHEITLSPGVLADPVSPGQFLDRGYIQQHLAAEGCRVILDGWNGKTTILDLSRDKWKSNVTLQIACPSEKSADECPRPVETTASFRVTSRVSRIFLGQKRTIITVACDVYTKKYGKSGSTQYIFISGIGVFSNKLPENLRAQQLSIEELQRLDDHVNALMSAEKRGHPTK